MNLPPILDRKALDALAAPDEKTAVRVVLLKTNNAGPYRLRCRARQYVFERDGQLGQHVLVIPLSVWMANIPPGPYRQNSSVSHDLMPTVATPFVIQVVPWSQAGDDEVTPEDDVLAESGIDRAKLPILTRFFEKLGAPPIVKEALGLLESESIENFQAFVDGINISPSDESECEDGTTTEESSPRPPADQQDATTEAQKTKEPSMEPAAVRMREMRARKKAEKVAAKELAKKKPKKATHRKREPVQA